MGEGNSFCLERKYGLLLLLLSLWLRCFERVQCSKDKPITMKRVNVPDVDVLFTNIAKSFNKQQSSCLAIWETLQNLKETYSCSPASSLSVCIEKIKQEHKMITFSYRGLKGDAIGVFEGTIQGICHVQVHMEGYKFWLDVREKEVPEKLEWAQRQVEKLNRATIVVTSMETKLQEMISSVLQNQEKWVDRVKVANSEYLDQIRLEENLKENIEKISLAKQYSKLYREEANNVLREMSKSASLTL